MTVAEQRDKTRQDRAIEAAADALLAVCVLQAGSGGQSAFHRALVALAGATGRAA